MGLDASNNNNIKILVIDDEPDILLVLKAVLEQEGHYVKTFDKPAQALAHIGSNAIQYDLVITDYRMTGGVSGLDLAQAIKDCDVSTGKRRKTKILLITAYETSKTSSIFSQALQTGLINGIIQKPVSNSELSAAIEKAFIHNNNHH